MEIVSDIESSVSEPTGRGAPKVTSVAPCTAEPPEEHDFWTVDGEIGSPSMW
jgi:hypothetical protein